MLLPVYFAASAFPIIRTLSALETYAALWADKRRSFTFWLDKKQQLPALTLSTDT